ncbi:M13 family metallopeptidase [Ulvibacter litoralis]|uniref:Putative endopeptidase n=1 Tax=Ulvibacter litoralis TaxID=227084 RepID=A0A1G7FIA4_9FLAO|nr:M13 family metallopeptidase [Ulvibacter litoralis]GHC50989.1 peptidase M13 [Ulvibacter litoralis]SDE75547.1 putative endopeptidase [Ulvibacter litoralis]
MKNLFLFSLFFSVFISCKNDTKDTTNDTAQTITPVVFDGVDTSIKPGDDFFNHVNKKWFDTAVIADDQVGVGSYRFLNIPQQELLKNILEEVSQKEHPKGSVEQMVGDFYASGMDIVKINNLGSMPIQPILNRIDAIASIPAITEFVATQVKSGDYSMVSPHISPDQKNSSLNILHFSQTGLGLPDRDYYFGENPSVKSIQEAYKTYVTTLFELVGASEAKKNAEIVYAIEKQLAASHKTRIERRVIKENYHKMAVSELNANHPNIGWNALLKNLGANVDSVDVRQPAYYDALNSMLGTITIEDWKLYLKAHSIASHDNILSTPFQDASFEYSKVITGQSVQQSRSKLMVRRVDQQIGFALGQLYVKRYFNEDAKKRALALVNNFQKTLEKRISNLDWMSDSTKVKAKEKLYAISKKIGYPDVWRTYDASIDRDHFFENVVALRKDDYQYELKQLNKAPNREEWHTTPSTVTAYYNPSLNEIVFPAGILQAPYFDLYADDAVNYGGIGMVIGHEFTHAFDDQGAQYDKNGNVTNWWTEADYTKFKAKTQQVIDQYDAFTVLDSVPIKGALTVGENTADNGGIAIAFDAFKSTAQGQDTTKIGGHTPNQRFFLSVATIWRVKTRDEYLRNYVATDPHSPPIWRVNGPLMNFTPFYEAFTVSPGDANYKVEDERIKIW